MVEILPKGRWINAAVVADEGIHGLRGSTEGVEFVPGIMKYVIIGDGQIVAWESFEKAGNPAERLEIQVIKGVDPERFLQNFAKLYGKEYVYLPHRGGAGYKCFHLEPVPGELLKLPALMGLGGAWVPGRPNITAQEISEGLTGSLMGQ